MTDAFKAWVEKWKIGPGMNDTLGVEHANKKRIANGEDLLPLRTRYSGYDGSVDDGWVPILDRLAADLVAMGWDGAVYQIKEKFGGLRFYANLNSVPEHVRETAWARIREAERESYKTCDTCGTREDVTTGPKPSGCWIVSRCLACRHTITSPIL